MNTNTTHTHNMKEHEHKFNKLKGWERNVNKWKNDRNRINRKNIKEK